jgi:hypothetical protein
MKNKVTVNKSVTDLPSCKDKEMSDDFVNFIWSLIKVNKIKEKSCPACSNSHLEVFFELSDMPVFCNLLWKEKLAARNCAKGDIKLAFCPSCGFIGNTAFDLAKLDYTEDYECSLDFSPRFQSYAQSLAKQLIEKHDLHQKKIIEIGSGKGDFLLLLCELGENYGIGFDPTYVYQSQHDRYQVEFIQDYYSESYAHYQGDFIICRHTLEHIPNPASFLKTLRQNIGDRFKPQIFFEVPNALDTFHNLAIWDIIYEHCCYFSPVSLSSAFTNCGFQVTETKEEYRGQFLCLEAFPDSLTQSLAKEQTEALTKLKNDIVTFRARFQQKVTFWQNKLQEIADRNQRVVLWGAGSKGVTFLNILKNQQQIEYIVDINPNKKGKYIPGTGQQIVAPEFLRNYQPDLVIVMNPIYQNEIKQMLA